MASLGQVGSSQPQWCPPSPLQVPGCACSGQDKPWEAPACLPPFCHLWGVSTNYLREGTKNEELQNKVVLEGPP